MEWIPEFALSSRELQQFNSGSAVRLIRRAAAAVYTTDNYKRRGEFGELILHVAIRQVASTVPAVSKLYFKDSPNDTVKGFDAVHVVVSPQDELELWLGEAKFYGDLSSAITAATQSLREHTAHDYLRTEFGAILNKIEDGWPHAGALRRLLDPNTSLDAVFKSLCIPVLLTYESECVKSFKEASEAYAEAFACEAQTCHGEFVAAGLPPVRIHLFLLPIEDKEALVACLHERLRAWQS